MNKRVKSSQRKRIGIDFLSTNFLFSVDGRQTERPWSDSNPSSEGWTIKSVRENSLRDRENKNRTQVKLRRRLLFVQKEKTDVLFDSFYPFSLHSFFFLELTFALLPSNTLATCFSFGSFVSKSPTEKMEKLKDIERESQTYHDLKTKTREQVKKSWSESIQLHNPLNLAVTTMSELTRHHIKRTRNNCITSIGNKMPLLWSRYTLTNMVNQESCRWQISLLLMFPVNDFAWELNSGISFL